EYDMWFRRRCRAWLGTPPRFQTRSTSIARDFFYYYDEVRHFHAHPDSKISRSAEKLARGRGARWRLKDLLFQRVEDIHPWHRHRTSVATGRNYRQNVRLYDK